MLPNWLYGKSKSKLAELLGGGGTPADYDQVKAQVTQNTDDIEELTDDLTTVNSGILTVDSENADLQWNYSGASANNIALSFKGFITTKRDATSGENSWINIGTVSKKPKVAQQLACPKINVSEGTIVCTNISIDTSGNVLFNMRTGMKGGDQFTTCGVILL